MNNYTDYTHYAPEINDRMLGCFASGEYLVTEAASTAELLETTRAQAAQLLERYPQIPE